MAIQTAERLQNYLRAAARVDKKCVRKTAFYTCDAKVLKKLLLDTGGELIIVISATVYHYLIKTEHLGVGVYNVWLERKDK